MAFVMHQDRRGKDALGDHGGGLGAYGSNGIEYGLFVELDTFRNKEANPTHDPFCNSCGNGDRRHVAILTSGDSKDDRNKVVTTLHGDTRLDPRTSDEAATLLVQYCGQSTGQLKVWVLNGERISVLNVDSLRLDALFSGPNVYVGFTAGTGTATDNQEVESLEITEELGSLCGE